MISELIGRFGHDGPAEETLRRMSGALDPDAHSTGTALRSAAGDVHAVAVAGEGCRIHSDERCVVALTGGAR